MDEAGILLNMSKLFSQSSALKIFSPKELFRLLTPPMVAEDLSVVSDQNYILLDLNPSALAIGQIPPKTRPNCPIIGLSRNAQDSGLFSWVDLMINLPDEEHLLEQILKTINAQPLAASTLVGVLRETLNMSIEQALMVESLAYSTLQNSHGFRAWLAAKSTHSKPRQRKEQSKPTVLIERHHSRTNNSGRDRLIISLNRPAKSNAFSALMRDELSTALQLAVADTSLEQIILQGVGDNFCAGGDLSEFGEAKDAGLAHLTRITRSPGALIAELNQQISVKVQGACIGAGIELPAFASTIAAEPDAYFALPEVGFGLIPGAGGTVSIPRRIGRQNTAKLALMGSAIKTVQAIEWGLIDKING
jgi:enoyl-CoA hydratase/carnithine racemase